MLSKFKRLTTGVLILLFSAQILLLYREYVYEVRHSYGQIKQNEHNYFYFSSAKKDLDRKYLNDKYQMKGLNRNRESTLKTIPDSTTSTLTTGVKFEGLQAQHNHQAESSSSRNKINQSTYSEVIRDLKTDPARGGLRINFSKYDGHDLLKDPVFKFNQNFKNPCWFEDDKLYCLPYVFIIGVKKCGTSDLFNRLSLHPDFVRPSFKEAQWFARKRFRSGGNNDDIYTFVSMFSRVAEKIQEFSNTSADGQIYNFKHITGEGSPSNLHLNSHWKYLPGNENLLEPRYVILDYIHHLIPQAKMIIIFRDPVDRLYSDYYHEYGTMMRNNRPHPGQFHEIVTAGVKLYKDCFNHLSVRSCVYEPTLYEQTKFHIQLGIYYIFWQELTRLFQKEQILVLHNKSLQDKELIMKATFYFLGLRNLTDEEMGKIVNEKEAHNRCEPFRKEGPMLEETQEILREFYRPFNRLMSEITGDNAFLYGYGNDTR